MREERTKGGKKRPVTQNKETLAKQKVKGAKTCWI